MRIDEKFLDVLQAASQDAVDIKNHQIGIVESINPLRILVNRLPLTENFLIINEDLLEHTEYFETLTGTIGDRTTTISDGSISFKSKLNVGDRVMMRDMGNNKFYVSNKVKVGGANG